MFVEIISDSKEKTLKIGNFVAKKLFPGSVITLTGDLGAGKTTFTKGVGEGLGIKDEINSPTFNILKCYFNPTLNLYHIDAYRLEDVSSEGKNIGLEEIGTHTLRKTFGYWFYKETKDIALLQQLFNHSSPSITLKYIGINQDVLDTALDNFSL